MSNNYYNFTGGPFIPGTKARSDQVNTEYQAIVSAFDLMPTSTSAIVRGVATYAGATGGTGNAYTVTMPNTRTSYQDGDEIVFQADRTSTAAATLNADSLGPISIVRADGSATAANDFLSGLIYAVRYDSANTRFIMMTPSASYLTDAAASAAAAATSETNAATSETNAAASETASAASALEAYHWAQYAVDALVPEGDLATEYSAYHWATKAAASAAALALPDPITALQFLRGNAGGTAWEQFDLLNTANSWTVQQTYTANPVVQSNGGSFIIAQSYDLAHDGAFQGHLTRAFDGTSRGFFGSIPGDLDSYISAYTWDDSLGTPAWNRVFGAHRSAGALQLTATGMTFDSVNVATEGRSNSFQYAQGIEVDNSAADAVLVQWRDQTGPTTRWQWVLNTDQSLSLDSSSTADVLKLAANSAALQLSATALTFGGANVLRDNYQATISSASWTYANLITFSAASGGLISDAATKAMYLCGGQGGTAANGAYVVAFGNSHATYPGRLNLVPGSAGEVFMYNSATTQVLGTNTTGVELNLTYGKCFSNDYATGTVAEFVVEGNSTRPARVRINSGAGANTNLQLWEAGNTKGIVYHDATGHSLILRKYKDSDASALAYLALDDAGDVDVYTGASGAGTGVVTLWATELYIGSAGNAVVPGCKGELQFTTSFTLIDGYQHYQLVHTANAVTVTIPPSVFPVGTVIEMASIAGGAVTIARGVGVTLYSNGGGAYVANADKTLSVGYNVRLVCVNTNIWYALHSGGVA